MSRESHALVRFAAMLRAVKADHTHLESFDNTGDTVMATITMPELFKIEAFVGVPCQVNETDDGKQYVLALDGIEIKGAKVSGFAPKPVKDRGPATIEMAPKENE